MDAGSTGSEKFSCTLCAAGHKRLFSFVQNENSDGWMVLAHKNSLRTESSVTGPKSLPSLMLRTGMVLIPFRVVPATCLLIKISEPGTEEASQGESANLHAT